jgi:hypothetical protein
MELLILIAIIWLFAIGHFASCGNVPSRSTAETAEFANGHSAHTLTVDKTEGEDYILLIGPEQFVHLKLAGQDSNTKKFEIGHRSGNLNKMHEGSDWFSFQSKSVSPTPSHGCLQIDAVARDGSKKRFVFIHVMVVPGRSVACLIKYSSGLDAEDIIPPSDPSWRFAGTDRAFEIERGKIYFAVGSPGCVLNFKFRDDSQFGFPTVEFQNNVAACEGIYPTNEALSEYVYSWKIGDRPEGGWGWCHFPSKDGKRSKRTCIFVVPIDGLLPPGVWRAKLTTDPANPFNFSPVTISAGPSPNTPNQDKRLGGRSRYSNVIQSHLRGYLGGAPIESYPGFRPSSGSYSGSGSGNESVSSDSRRSATTKGAQQSKTTSCGWISPEFSDFVGGIPNDIDIVPHMQRSSSGSLYSTYRGQSVRGTRQSGGYSMGIRSGTGGGWGARMTSNIPRRDKPWGKSSFTVGGGKGYGKGRR